MLQREMILQQALGLPPEDRAVVADALTKSLAVDFPETTGELSNHVEAGPESVSGEEFLRELQRRSEKLRSGQANLRPATEVLADLLRRQAAETRK